MEASVEGEGCYVRACSKWMGETDLDNDKYNDNEEDSDKYNDEDNDNDKDDDKDNDGSDVDVGEL